MQKVREYYRCRTCGLIFLSPTHFLTPEAEKARYDLHRNSPCDEEYRKFLSPVLNSVLQNVEPGSSGLDFGSGPGPTLSVMLEEFGHRVSLFDPFYANFPLALKEEYDFITATEVVEHMHYPRRDFMRLWACIKKGGLLAVMTKMPPDHRPFLKWYYKDDPTHVIFFSRQTFNWLADYLKSVIHFTDEGVVLFFKK